MRFNLKWALALLPVLALATPASAQVLAHTNEPGSVIIFPKFVNAPAVSVDGAVLPRTEIEIGAVCPAGFNTTPGAPGLCTEHTTVKVRFHWVCPGDQTVVSKFVCQETDFDVTLTINGKLAFTADGTPLNSNSPVVPSAPCPAGYLIGWVINQSDQPIRFDSLIGDAVLRGPQNVAGPSANLSTAVEGYKAITIQAVAGPENIGQPTVLGGDPLLGTPTLVFDGLPGHYTQITGNLYGDVKYDRTTIGGGPSPVNALSETFLVLLTLDVRSNQPNWPTFVPLQFYNESLNTVSGTNPNFERLVSTFTEFLCWEQVQLSNIDPNLTQVGMQTRKGLVHAGPARKIPFIGISDFTLAPNNAVTLIGLVQTIEGTAANNFLERSYIYNMFDDSIGVPTFYLPFPF